MGGTNAESINSSKWPSRRTDQRRKLNFQWNCWTNSMGLHLILVTKCSVINTDFESTEMIFQYVVREIITTCT